MVYEIRDRLLLLYAFYKFAHDFAEPMKVTQYLYFCNKFSSRQLISTFFTPICNTAPPLSKQQWLFHSLPSFLNTMKSIFTELLSVHLFKSRKIKPMLCFPSLRFLETIFQGVPRSRRWRWKKKTFHQDMPLFGSFGSSTVASNNKRQLFVMISRRI